MTKTLNQIIFLFLHQNQNIFFSNIGNQNILFRRKTYPPPWKLIGPSLMYLTNITFVLVLGTTSNYNTNIKCSGIFTCKIGNGGNNICHVIHCYSIVKVGSKLIYLKIFTKITFKITLKIKAYLKCIFS
jgi:hypothetical protein